MISFDYLHSSRRRLLLRVLDTRIPARLYAAFAALGVALSFTVGAWSIENYRLRAALQIEASYQERCDRSVRALEAADVYFERVRDLVTIDKKVRDIIASGAANARRLAALANALPKDAWLTAISHDDSGLILQGDALDFATLGRALSALTRAPEGYNPSLLSASVEENGRNRAVVRYSVRVDGGTP